MEETGLHEGDMRLIIADAPAEGYVFDQWTGDVAYLDDPMSSTTIVTMPAANVEVTATYIQFPLELTFMTSGDFPVADPSNEGDWNVWFDLPANGTPFTSAIVDDNKVSLYGGANIKLIDDLFAYNGGDYVTRVDDLAGCCIEIGEGVFGGDNCLELLYVNFPNVVTIGTYAFEYAEEMTTVLLPNVETLGSSCFSGVYLLTDVDFPKAKTIGSNCFSGCVYCSLYNLPLVETIGDDAFEEFYGIVGNRDFYIPSCISLGSTVGNDGVFRFVSNKTITLTIPCALNSDGDVAYLTAPAQNNIVTIVNPDAPC